MTEDEIIDEDISGDTEEDISGNDIEDISEDISDTENVGDDVAEDEIIDENVTGDISGDIEEDISEDDIIDPETNEAADIEDEVLNTGDEVVDAEGEDIGDGEIDTEVDEVADEETDITDVDVEDKEPDAESEGIGDEVIDTGGDEVADEETDITDVDVEDKEPDAESEGIGDEVIDTEVDGVADEEIDMQNVDTESEVLNAESEDIGDEVIATEADEVADEETDMEDVDIEDKESDAESEGIGDEVIDTGVDEVADEETDITDVDIEDKEPDAESEGIGDEVIDTEVDEVADEVYNVSKEVEISPSMIEGIHLGEHELEKPDVFWSQHEKNGTLESFKEVASHIPDVKEQLASGRTIDELLADSELSECADVYFMNKPKVIENDGYYEFDSNGRHRILAARAAGYDIPVEVIGRRYRNEDVELQDIDADVSELHVNMEGELSEQTAGENKEFGSFFDKIQNFFNPSKNSDLIDHSVADDSDSNQDIQTQWRPPAIQGADVKEPEADITPLDSTRQTINLVELPDGSKARVFDHPSDLKNILPFSQGKNEYSKSGTCALADTGVWLKIAGSKHVENDVVGFASTHADRRGQPLCSRSGGTLPSNIPDIWEHFGIPAYSDGSRSLENIAEAVESGKAVSVGVNAGMLWELDNVEGIKLSKECYGDGGANHAIGIMSCERDSLNGNITHFYINDTGRTYERDACRKINVDDFWKAFNVKRACATISQKPVW